MHADEVAIDEPLVRGLLTDQFPEWAELPLRRVQPEGTDNAIFRLGEGLSVRLPRIGGSDHPGSPELTWLPRLAPRLPVAVPVPVVQGRPGRGYPWCWAVHRWVPGESQSPLAGDPLPIAEDLCALISALQRVDGAGGPPGRGIPLAQRDADARYWLERFDHRDHRAATAAWDRALAATPWLAPPVWHHGDLDARNWLVADGRISGVIDWSAMGVGDPACDLMVAFKLHSPAGRDAVMSAIEADAATWERARGWAVSQAVAILAYYTPHNNPVLVDEAESWLALALDPTVP